MWRNKILIIREGDMDRAGVEPTEEAALEFILQRFDELGDEGWEPWNSMESLEGLDDDIIGVWYFKRWVADDVGI
jgi:hypothetical protein